MKYFSAFFGILFCACNGSQNTEASILKDSIAFDSSEVNVPTLDSSPYHGPSGYTHLLEIVSEYSFNPNLTSTYEEALEWLSSEGLPASDGYSEEESHSYIDFEILSRTENASCSFHFEYSADGEYSTYRHIIKDVEEDLKSAFIEELKVWYSGALELESIEAKCFQKKWGATGYVWEEKTQYGIVQSSIQRSPADDSYPWIELRRNGYKDVADDELIECD